MIIKYAWNSLDEQKKEINTDIRAKERFIEKLNEKSATKSIFFFFQDNTHMRPSEKPFFHRGIVDTTERKKSIKIKKVGSKRIINWLRK